MHSAMMIKFFVAMLVITNPIAAIPIFISLTEDKDIKAQRRIAIKATIAIFCIIIITTWVGLPLLHFFGIDIGSFKVAGGIIILLMGLSMLQSHKDQIRHSYKEHEHAKVKSCISIVPIALPLMAGPGAISTIITWTSNYSSLMDKLTISGLDLLISLVLGLALFFSGALGKLLGTSGVSVTTKIMGMILAAIAITMIATGLVDIFPAIGPINVI